MKPRIVRNIERPDPDVVRKLGDFGTATVHEAQGRTGLMLPYMRPIYPTARIGSPAVTVLCHPGDNLMFHAAIEVCKPGDVLVVATHSDSTDGFFGELLATSCQAHGIKGLVIHAGVRDVADLTAMQFPAFSRAISAQGTVKETAGYVNIDIVCAGALVHPGDVIVGTSTGSWWFRGSKPRRSSACAKRASPRKPKIASVCAPESLGLTCTGCAKSLKNLGVEWV